MRDTELLKKITAQLKRQADDLVVWDTDHISTYVHGDIAHGNRTLLDGYDARDWKNVKEKTVDPYQVTPDDDVILANNGSGMNVNLPPATGSGKVYTIKNIGSASINVNPNGADTINGVAAPVILVPWDVIRAVDMATGAWGEI